MRDAHKYLSSLLSVYKVKFTSQLLSVTYGMAKETRVEDVICITCRK
jgi:hypothetical protein